MSKGARIEASQPSAAAADPAHPDHARWTLERLLAEEAAWKRKTGRAPDVGEMQAHWGRTLERLRRKRRGRQVTPDRRRRRQGDPAKALLRESGHYSRGQQRIAPPRCPCPTKDCRSCRLHRRVQQLVQVDASSFPPTLRYPAYGMAIAMAMAEAARAAPRDRDRIIARRIEDIAERSRAHLGEWDRPLAEAAG